jgi:hypothetical protein
MPNQTLQQTAAAILVPRDTTALGASAAAELDGRGRRGTRLSEMDGRSSGSRFGSGGANRRVGPALPDAAPGRYPRNGQGGSP